MGIREISGAYYFMLRICDLRVHHALLEAHVRCYCGHKHPSRGYEMLPMRLEHPDDELGGCVLMNIPITVVHRIDAWSPLAPACTNSAAAREGIEAMSHSLSDVRDKELTNTSMWPG